MMKLASIVPYKIMLPVKGGERAIYFFLKYLSAYGNVYCFTVEENSIDTREPFKVIPLLGSTKNKSRYANAPLFFKLRAVLKSEGISHLIIEHPYYGWLGYALKKFAGVKLIVRSHNIESQRFRSVGKRWWKALYRYEKFVHRNADLNIFITPEDRDYAIKNFRLHPKKCMVCTYGIEMERVTASEKIAARKAILQKHYLQPGTKLILYNGALNYRPNLDALDKILMYINPLLKQRFKAEYKIIICGFGLPDDYFNLSDFANDNIIYEGFVNNIGEYFAGVDLFICPITDGGGIKTKLVEALGANTPVVSFKSAAFGIPTDIAGDFLTVINDNDFESFTNAVVSKLESTSDDISPEFYDYFNWDSIAKKAVDAIKRL